MSAQAPKVEFGSQLAKIARLYYLEHWPQRRIAERYGMSVPTVSRALARARERGIVHISVTDDRPFEELELRCEQAFDLDEVIVVPFAESPGAIYQDLGDAVGSILTRRVPQQATVGVGWGDTLGGLAPFLPHIGPRNAKVVPIVGAMGAVDRTIYPNAISREIASRLESDAFVVNGPAVFESEDAIRLFMSEKSFEPIRELWQGLDIAILGASDVGPTTSMARNGVLSEAELSELRELGAVSVFNFHFLDNKAKPISTDVAPRILSLPYDLIKRVPCRIVVALGDRKVAALTHLLQAKLVTVLVTDEPTARRLVE